MDPTLAPNFVPPSEQLPSQRVPRPLPSNMIPNNSPIQPYVLEDLRLSEIDAPLPRTPSISSISDAFSNTSIRSSNRSQRPSNSGSPSSTPPRIIDGTQHHSAISQLNHSLESSSSPAEILNQKLQSCLKGVHSQNNHQNHFPNHARNCSEEKEKHLIINKAELGNTTTSAFPDDNNNNNGSDKRLSQQSKSNLIQGTIGSKLTGCSNSNHKNPNLIASPSSAIFSSSSSSSFSQSSSVESSPSLSSKIVTNKSYLEFAASSSSSASPPNNITNSFNNILQNSNLVLSNQTSPSAEDSFRKPAISTLQKSSIPSSTDQSKISSMTKISDNSASTSAQSPLAAVNHKASQESLGSSNSGNSTIGSSTTLPTPIPSDIPRIPSELDRPTSPIRIDTPIDTPFPRLGPSQDDVAPDQINSSKTINQQNFVPQTPSSAEYFDSECSNNNNNNNNSNGTSSQRPVFTNQTMTDNNQSVFVEENNSLSNGSKASSSSTSSSSNTITPSNKNSRSNSSFHRDDRSSIYDADDAGNPYDTPYTMEAATGGARPIVHSADLEEVPVGVTRQAQKISEYKFPSHRLARVMQDETKSPLVIVACGSFSPITYLHLRMFEMAMDSIREQTRFEVIGGYYSPVSDNYKKQGLAAAHHRVRMCELACERTSSWLMVDAWESLQPTYQRTAVVLDHFNHEINIKRGGIATSSGKRKGVKIMLLAGGDLIESMGEPNVWAEEDLHHILGRYGCLIVERTGSDVRSFLLSHDIMYEHRRNVLVIKQLIYNDISSTKVRLFIRRGMSVQYLIPNSVIRYIQEHGLYIHETEPVKQVLSEKGD